MPAFGEEVGIWRSQDKKLIKSANNRGAIGRLIEVTPWQNGTTSLIAKGSDLQNPEIIHGLQPKIVAVDCLRLAEPRTIPEGWTKPASDAFAKQWNSIRTPEGKDLWIQLTTGKTQYSSPFVSELTEAKSADSFAYWGDVTEEGNNQVRQEVLDFVCPTQQPEQLRSSLTTTVPKARIIPNKLVMQTKVETPNPVQRGLFKNQSFFFGLVVFFGVGGQPKNGCREGIGNRKLVEGIFCPRGVGGRGGHTQCGSTRGAGFCFGGAGAFEAASA